MENLKQSTLNNRITPTTPSREANKRRRKGPVNSKQHGPGRKQSKTGRNDGHQIDEFA